MLRSVVHSKVGCRLISRVVVTIARNFLPLPLLKRRRIPSSYIPFMKKDSFAQALRSYTQCRSLLVQQGPYVMKEIVAAFLAQIEKQGDINAFVRVYKEEVQQKAEVIAIGDPKDLGFLEGMVVGIKDLFSYVGHPLQASSKILEGFVSQITATSVERLRQAGAIIIGHQNCDEFGMGSSNENTIYGWVKNPVDKRRSAGGSSGGSAAAVRAQMCHVSLGTDTGGSIQQPAAFTGVVGLRPTYSRISRYGVIAHASSFDTVGIMANNIPDCAAALQVMAGKDEKDNTSSSCPVPAYTNLLAWDPTKRCNIAYFKEAVEHPSIQPEVKAQTLALLARLEAAGHHVACIDFPLLSYALPTYYILTSAEATANLARYDGVRYGFRAEGKDFEEMITRTRTLGFGEEVKRRLVLGALVLTSDHYDSTYQRAQKVRSLIQAFIHKTLSSYDHIITPTTPTTAFFTGHAKQDAATEYLADLYTVTPAIAGVPAISIPNGEDQQQLPIGVQVMGRPFQEQALLAFSQYLLEELP